MKALVIEKKLPLELFDIIRFQIVTYCFLKKIRISPAQLDSLAYLGMWGTMNISDFCDQIVQEELFTNAQTVRNFMIKCIKDGLVDRTGAGNKLISISPTLELILEGNMLINMKVYYVEQNEG